jgi:hypothetical protein
MGCVQHPSPESRDCLNGDRPPSPHHAAAGIWCDVVQRGQSAIPAAARFVSIRTEPQERVANTQDAKVPRR